MQRAVQTVWYWCKSFFNYLQRTQCKQILYLSKKKEYKLIFMLATISWHSLIWKFPAPYWVHVSANIIIVTIDLEYVNGFVQTRLDFGGLPYDHAGIGRCTGEYSESNRTGCQVYVRKSRKRSERSQSIVVYTRVLGFVCVLVFYVISNDRQWEKRNHVGGWRVHVSSSSCFIISSYTMAVAQIIPAARFVVASMPRGRVSPLSRATTLSFIRVQQRKITSQIHNVTRDTIRYISYRFTPPGDPAGQASFSPFRPEPSGEGTPSRRVRRVVTGTRVSTRGTLEKRISTGLCMECEGWYSQNYGSR